VGGKFFCVVLNNFYFEKVERELELADSERRRLAEKVEEEVKKRDEEL